MENIKKSKIVNKGIIIAIIIFIIILLTALIVFIRFKIFSSKLSNNYLNMTLANCSNRTLKESIDNYVKSDKIIVRLNDIEENGEKAVLLEIEAPNDFYRATLKLDKQNNITINNGYNKKLDDLVKNEPDYNELLSGEHKIVNLFLSNWLCGTDNVLDLSEKDSKKNKNDEDNIQLNSTIDEISEYGYTLNNNETKLYKDLFNELSKILSKNSVDEKKYAELVCELFVSDFYNLDNKTSKNDIGGTQFIHSEAVDKFVLNAKNTMYKNVGSDTYKEFPIVTNVKLGEVKDITFKYNNSDVAAYSVTLSWEYENDLDYDNEKEFILIKEGKKLSIVQMNDIDENNKD